jgi:hypothetical protein
VAFRSGTCDRTAARISTQICAQTRAQTCAKKACAQKEKMSATPRPLQKYGLWVAAILIPFLWLCWVRTASVQPHCEIENDGYYHAMMADLYPEVCTARTFPHLTMSIWRDHFYDKELAFHALLSGVRRYSQVLGLSLGPPFHVPALTFALLMVGAFVLVAFSWKIPKPALFSILLVAISPFFTYRLLMLRPHNLAIALMLLYCWQVFEVKEPRRLWIPFAFGILFAYAYSNPHFVLLPAVIYGAIQFRKNRSLAIQVPLATLLGLVAGFILHPQFPNTFLLWKIQSIDVVIQAFSPGAAVYVGEELARPDWQWLFQNAGLLLLLPLNGWALYVLRRKNPRPETLLCFAMQAVTTLGVFMIKRSAEYACPFGALTLGLLVRDMANAGLFRRWKFPRPSLVPVAAAGALLLIAGFFQIRFLKGICYPEFKRFGEWAGKALPDGTVIANLIWGDFPMLFYSAPQFRYTMGLDPMFGYRWNPEKVERLEKFRTGQLLLTPRELMELTDARFAFVPSRAAPLAQLLVKNGFAVAYRGPDGWLFDLEPNSPSANPPRPTPSSRPTRT